MRIRGTSAWTMTCGAVLSFGIAASLQAYRAGLRESGIMEHAASQLSDDQIAKLADHFGAKEPPPPPTTSASCGAPRSPAPTAWRPS